MVNVGPLIAEFFRFGSLGHPSKFQWVSRLRFVTTLPSCNESQPNFAQRLAVSWAGTLYMDFGGSCPLMEFCQVQNSLCVQVLHYPILAALLHGTRAVGVNQTVAWYLHATGRPSRLTLGGRYRLESTDLSIYIVSQNNVPPLACCNFDTHEWISTFCGRNVTDKVSNQKTLHCATSNNFLHYLAKWENMKIAFFTQLDCVTRTMHLCSVFLKEKIVICDVFDSV